MRRCDPQAGEGGPVPCCSRPRRPRAGPEKSCSPPSPAANVATRGPGRLLAGMCHTVGNLLGFHYTGLADVDDLREGARFFTDAVGHFPSFWELSLRKKPHASVGPDPRFYGNRMWNFFSHTRPQNRKVQPPAEVKECATVLAGVRSSQCPAF